MPGRVEETIRKASEARTPPAERILAVATELFARQGYNGTSMRQIAQGVGVALPSIYFQFKDKRELYRHAVIRIMAEANRVPDETLSLPDPRERLRAYVYALTKSGWETPVILQYVSRAMIDNDTEGLEYIIRSVMGEGQPRLLRTIESVTGKPASMVDLVAIYSLIMGMMQFRAFGGQIGEDLDRHVGSAEDLARHVLEILYPDLV